MMSETVVTMDGSSNNASNNQRQVPTVKTEPGQPNPLASIRLNAAYFKTIPGILKLAQLIAHDDHTCSSRQPVLYGECLIVTISTISAAPILLRQQYRNVSLRMYPLTLRPSCHTNLTNTSLLDVRVLY
ncbi:hypothetical protein EAG_05831 [Camponotus floridanus]|uniref:Uncharacterized protein n=1 Tax=Camponotus floridanus TaxID=104421 RepID=E2AZP6_CAMFO|nr:hypothetical protein EAG_05831 [Camponotus floridanus]